MGIETSYRTSTDKQEILSALMDIYAEGTSITVWQNIDSRRVIVNVKIQDIDLKTESIIIGPYNPDDREAFLKLQFDSTLYIRGESKSIVFKQDKPAIKNKSGLVRIFIPDEVKMFEKRTEARLVFSSMENILITEIYIGDRIDVSSKALRGQLHNVSLSGMGFFLEAKNARLFFERDKIKIKNIATYVFPRPIFGQIVYIKPDETNSKRVRVGVKFAEKITTEILQKINELANQ